jgi:hypothetical protein
VDVIVNGFDWLHFMVAPYLFDRVLSTSIHAVKKKETPRVSSMGVNPANRTGRGRRETTARAVM